MTNEAFSSMNTAADEAPDLLPASGYRVSLTLETDATGARRWYAMLTTLSPLRVLATSARPHETPEAAAWDLVEVARAKVDELRARGARPVECSHCGHVKEAS